MVNFVDEYERQIDDHNRIILPPKIREDVGENVYITQAPSDKCLHLYTESEWEKVSAKVSELPTAIDKNAAAFVRTFFGKATKVSVDKQGRVSVARRLIEYADLTKEVVLVGANTRLEIWDLKTWQEYQSKISEDIMIDGILKYGLNI